MNYIGPSFYFQQGDELLLQSSSVQRQQQQEVIQDMLVGAPSLIDGHHGLSLNFQTGGGRRKKMAAATADNDADDDDGNNRSSKNKKLIHRDVERQRRHEMATLYSSLRLLLPVEYLKGKRSISDHMNEAANYIKHKQKKIRELTEKRDGLRRVLLASSDSGTLDASLSSPCVIVRPCWAGLEVVISNGLGESVPLSKVMALLSEAGLSVVSCSSINVKERSVHTLQSEVGDPREVDSSGLNQKLIDLIQPSSWVSRL
ncbi:transcription factor bHLH118-like [Tasmannia lanceolata]|uniref:transcription factor bHLH118-like n=1 Tax=Tasmannia lanceolata TaxID=3420 RepID=UPI0040639B8E